MIIVIVIYLQVLPLQGKEFQPDVFAVGNRVFF